MRNFEVTKEQNGDEYGEEFFRAAFGIAPLAEVSAPSEDSRWIRNSSLPEQLVEAIEDQFKNLLDGKEFIYVTVHLDARNLRRKALADENPSVLPLGRRFVESVEAGSPIQTAYENMFAEFFPLLERELKCRVGSIRVYENDGKRFKRGAPVTHVHMCIPLPKGRSYYRFINAFARVFAAKVYPVPIPADGVFSPVKADFTLDDLKKNPKELWATNMLHFKPGHRDSQGSSPDYSIKQIRDANALSERFFASYKK